MKKKVKNGTRLKSQAKPSRSKNNNEIPNETAGSQPPKEVRGVHSNGGVVRLTTSDSIKTMALEQLVEMQGELKELSVENFNKLKVSLKEHGFFVPVFLWRNPKTQKHQILDGHQRVRTLRQLKKEGWVIPRVPYVTLEAKNKEEAAQRLLLISSQFGQMTPEGLHEYLENYSLNPGGVVTDYALADIDAPEFIEEFYGNPSGDAATDINAPSETAKAKTKAEKMRSASNDVQNITLSFPQEEHGRFMECLAILKPTYGADSISEIVLHALAKEAERVSKA